MSGLPEHLRARTSPRGFDHLPRLGGGHGGTVRCYESSSAEGPHVWLAIELPPSKDHPGGLDEAVHLPAEEAWKLADQLRQLVAGHYQGDARPDWAVEVDR
jgi:hypothetical protein